MSRVGGFLARILAGATQFPGRKTKAVGSRAKRQGAAFVFTAYCLPLLPTAWHLAPTACSHMARSVDCRHLSSKPFLRKPLDRGSSGVGSEPGPQGRVCGQPGDRPGQTRGVAGCVAEPVVVVGEQLRRPTSRGDHHRLAAAHCLDDGQPERLRPDAGVNRHIEHPVRIGGVRLKRDEPDPASHPVRRRLLLQLLAGELRPRGGIDRPADDVTPDRRPGRGEPGQGVEKHVLPLPVGVGRHQPNPDHPRRGRLEPSEAVELQPRRGLPA